MLLITAVMLLISLFVAAIFTLFFRLSKTPSLVPNRPPGPRGLPLIGNLHQFDPLKTHIYFFQLSKKHGPLIYLKLGFVPTIVVSSPKLAKEVLKTQDLVFCSRPTFVGLQKLTYNGLDLSFGPYNDYWKEMRKICVEHLFSSNRVQSFSWIRQEEVSRMIRVISSLCSESKLVDLSGLLLSVANSIICRTAFSKNYNDDLTTSRFQGLLHETQAISATFFLSDFFPYLGLVDKISGASRKLERVFKVLDEFYQELINEHLDSHKQRSEDSEQHQDIIDVLLQLRKQHNLPFDLTFDHIKAVLLDIFVAGTDTNAATMVWAMTELVKNPTVLSKAQAEVRNLVEKQEGRRIIIQEEELHHLTYLKAVIKETFRLHPPSPLLLPRKTMQKCTLGGYQIERDTLVYINAWAIGRDPESWENPGNFMPERFIGSPIDYKGHDFELIPFGSGRRICPGLLMGATTIELGLANLLLFFDWDLPAFMKREDIDMDTLPGIAVHKKNALCLSATKFIDLQAV